MKSIKRMFSNPPFGMFKKPDLGQPLAEQLAEKYVSARRDDSASKRRILCVDDDKVWQDMMRGIQRSGVPVEVATAGSVGEAQRIMAEKPFDLIVVDYSIPNGHPTGYGNGKKLCQWILENYPSQSVLVLTGYDRDKVSEELGETCKSIQVYSKPTSDAMTFLAQLLVYASRRHA